MMHKSMLGTALSLFVLTLARPIAAQNSILRAIAPPEAHSVTFKFVPKAERKPVPFEIINGVLVFQANLNGQDVWAVLNNQMVSLIDDRFAAEQKITVGPQINPIVTPNGPIERRRALGVPFGLARQVELTAPFSVVDLAYLGVITGRPTAMVMGREFFSNLAFVILPTNMTFEVGPSGSLRLPDDIPFVTLEDDRPRVEANVGGHMLTLLVDLGTNSQILLNPEAWNGLALNEAPQRPSQVTTLDGKKFDVVHAKLPRVTIGPFVKENVVAALRKDLHPDVDGVVGLGFLSNFNFAIDVKARKLWMIAPVKKPAQPIRP